MGRFNTLKAHNSIVSEKKLRGGGRVRDFTVKTKMTKPFYTLTVNLL